MNILFEGLEKLNKKFLLKENMSWQEIKDSLQASIDEGEDPLDEYTDAGDEIDELCAEVEHNLGIEAEPSHRAGYSGLFFYNHGKTGFLDFGTFNEEIVELALESDSFDEFKLKYEDYISNDIPYEDDEWNSDEEYESEEDIDRNADVVVIPEGVTEIKPGQFYACDMTTVTLPSTLKKIGKEAFLWCSSLQSIIIPNSVEEIGKQAFGYCRSLTSITIPDSVTKIGSEAFCYCFNLQSINLPKNLKILEDNAFYTCNRTEILIPKSLSPTVYEGKLPENAKIKIV